jgi:hypothetical protein
LNPIPLPPSNNLTEIDCRKRGAGFFLPRAWWCPPDINKSPKIGGFRGFIKVISAISLEMNLRICIHVNKTRGGESPLSIISSLSG